MRLGARCATAPQHLATKRPSQPRCAMHPPKAGPSRPLPCLQSC